MTTTNDLGQLDPGKARFDAIKEAKREEERQKKLRRAELQRSRAEAVRIAYNRVEEKYRGTDTPRWIIRREKQREAVAALAEMFPRYRPDSRIIYSDGASYIVGKDGSYRREDRPSKAERRAARDAKRRRNSS